MKVLIDTNVILDALMNRAPWAEAAQELLRVIAAGKIKGCIIASQTTNIFYLLHRQGMDEATVKTIIQKLSEAVSVVGVTPADVQEALTCPMPDYEDALLACCAKRQKAAFIITRNERDFKQSPVKALSPQAFIQQLH